MQLKQTVLILLVACMWVGTTAKQPYVVVLGDSMASGQGLYTDVENDYPFDPIGNPATFDGESYDFAETPTPGVNCWRDFSKIAGAIVAKERRKELVNLACAYAFAGGVEQQWEYAKARYNLENADILITLGANDAIRLSPDGAIYTLDNILRCFGAILPWQSPNTDITDYEALEDILNSLFSKIATEAPDSATVRVVGNPLQFRPYKDFLCWSIVFPCARTLDALISRLNKSIEKVANQNSLQFVSVERGDPLPDAVCSVSDLHIRDIYINSLIPFSIGESSFHPTEKGHEEMAKRILSSY